jgi:FixJ family two-component response regulator
MKPSRGLIAIIDDDEGVRDSLALLLTLAGYAVRAYDSAEAFLNRWPEAPDCLILDQVMPGMTGLELASHLRGEGDAVPILLISGWLSATIESSAAQLSIRTLRKPIDEAFLLSFAEGSVREMRSAGALRGAD